MYYSRWGIRIYGEELKRLKGKGTKGKMVKKMMATLAVMGFIFLAVGLYGIAFGYETMMVTLTMLVFAPVIMWFVFNIGVIKEYEG